MRKRGVAALLIVASVVIPGSLILEAQPVLAYAYLPCKWSSKNITYGTPSQSAYVAVSKYAGNDWTVSTNVTFTQVFGSPVNGVELDASNLGNTGFDGISSQCPAPVRTSAIARWNAYYTDSYTSLEKQETMVHELGHILGLAHSGSSTCSGQPIMYYSRDRYSVCGHVVPQPDDIAGANALYP